MREAAVQGFMAGVNAALKIKGRPPFVLRPQRGLYGALIDDLVTRGTNEPLPHDDLAQRIPPDTAAGQRRRAPDRLRLRPGAREPRALRGRCRQNTPPWRRRWRGSSARTPRPRRSWPRARRCGRDGAESGASLASLIRRPRVGYELLAPFDPGRPELPGADAQAGGDTAQIRRLHPPPAEAGGGVRAPGRAPAAAGIDYFAVPGLRTEARQKLSAVRPRALAAAGRISGVSPADMAALMVYLRRDGR